MTRVIGRPFQKGASGNPRGRPRVPDDVREAARCYTMEAIETQVSVMRDIDAPPASRVTAAENILNRAWGKPESPVTLNAGDNFARILAAADAILAAGRADAGDHPVAAEPAAVRH